MTNDNEIDNATVRRFAKIIKGNNRSSKASVGITTGTVIQNGDQLSVIVDNETIVPISDATSNVKIGDKVTVAVNGKEGLIIGNNSDVSPTISQVDNVETLAYVSTTDASDAKILAQEAKKVATNYISVDENKGITVGSIQEKTIDKYIYIDSDGVYVRDGDTTKTPISLEGHNHSASNITSGTLAVARGGTGATDAATARTNLGCAATSHNHSASNITSGTLAVARGGTGATDAATARTNLGCAATSHNHSASNITSGTLAVARGGTGATDAATARTNLGCAATSHNHSASNITSGTLAVARGGTGKTTGSFYGIVNLYNNTTGTNGNVTLSQSAANFTYLEIYFYGSNNGTRYNSIKVYSPNGKGVLLQQSFWASGTTTTRTNFETITISATSITRGTMGYFQTSGSSVTTGSTTTRQFYIVRVDGYK